MSRESVLGRVAVDRDERPDGRLDVNVDRLCRLQVQAEWSEGRPGQSDGRLQERGRWSDMERRSHRRGARDWFLRAAPKQANRRSADVPDGGDPRRSRV